MINRWLKIIHATIIPARCLLCGAQTDQRVDLCRGCHQDLPWVSGACYHCGLPLDVIHKSSCGRCLRKPPPFQRTLSLLHYHYPVDHLITGLKFHQQLSYARLLGTLLGISVINNYEASELPQAIIPVPLHRRRLRERGYNQALEIARFCARKTGQPLLNNCCQRVCNTKPQTDLQATQREQNLKNAFKLTSVPPLKSIALVDDVMTTGATLSELSQTFLNAGVRKIHLWCIARTPLK